MVGFVLASCGTEDVCRREAVDTYQDYDISFDAGEDLTKVDAAVKEHSTGPTIKMSDNCRLHFNGDRLAEATRNVNETHYLGEYDGFEGDGTVAFTDKDGATVENSVPFGPGDFGLDVPATLSLSGFEIGYTAPGLEGGAVIVRVVPGSGPAVALRFGTPTSPVRFAAEDLATLTAGSDVEVTAEIVVYRRVTDPSDGHGRITYHHLFAPVAATLAP